MWKLVLLLAATCVVAGNARMVKRQAQPCPDECENTPLDISFIVDGSASIWPKNFTIGLWFLQNFIDQFEIGADQVRVSVVTFGDKVYQQDAIGFEQYTDKDELKKAIDEIPYRSGTATETGAAIKWYLENQEPTTRAGVRSVLIVLTDGNSQRGRVTKAEAQNALAKGLEIFAIGVGHAVSSEELHNIASDGEHVFIVSDYNALDDIQHRLTYETCGVKPHPICSHSPVDVAFVIDSSRSIGADNFTLELTFIKEFLEVFKINPSSARVAAIMFGDRVYEEKAINFDQFQSEKETLDAILGLEYMKGSRTETGAGIEYAINHFVPKFRDHAAHIGIVITDGQSQRWRFTREAAAEARAAGFTTVAVGVGRVGATGNLDQEELEHIAGDPSRVITASDFAQLNAIRDELTSITCEGIVNELQAKEGK